MAAAAAEGPKTLFSLVVRDAEKLKKLWAAFNFLSRVGKDLILEAEGDWLKLRALNESKTAYSVVELESSFFGPHGVLLHPDIDTFSCRVNLRQLCAVCKNLSKTSEKVTIRAESAADNSYQLVVEMQSKDTGILRLHRLQYSDCEVIDAVFEDQGASRLQASNKIFNQMLSNMYQSPEIAVLPTQDEFKVRSFHAIDHGQDKKHVTTDLNIETQDFDFYECKEEGNGNAGGGRGGSSSSSACSGPGGDGTNDVADSDSQVEANRSKKELVFCVRELKAILGLCDSIGNENFNMYWTTAGMPVKFECKTPGLGFTGTVILTTVVQRTQFPSSAAGNAAIAGSGAASASATNGNGKKRSSGASNKAGGGSKKKATTTSAAPAEDDDEMDVQPTRGRGSGKGKRRVEDDDDDDDDE